MNMNLAIENSRESSLADYASLSVILILALLMCFSIVLLANEAKRSATILAPAAFSESSAAKTSRAARPEALGEAMAAPSSSPIVETGRRIALPDMERAKTIRETPGHLARVREVNLRKSTANLYKRSGSFQAGASRRIKTLLITLWHHHAGKHEQLVTGTHRFGTRAVKSQIHQQSKTYNRALIRKFAAESRDRKNDS
jgi:hypothetical protein